MVSEEFSGLEEISIRNLGVIESAQISFSSGLNVITGETGAGKTMLLTALTLILGGKSEPERVRTGTERLMVAGSFALPSELRVDLLKEDIEIEDGSLLIARTISTDGKSRLSMGSAPVTNARVSEIAHQLVEIHAQSGSQRLMKSSYIRSALDKFSKLESMFSEYSELFETLVDLEERIERIKQGEAQRSKEIIALEEFLEALEKVKPKPSELEEIEAELLKLENVVEFEIALSNSLAILESEENSVTSQISNAQRALKSASNFDASIRENFEGLAQTIDSLNEIAGSLHRLHSNLEADPARLEYLQNRKSILMAFIKRFTDVEDRREALGNLISKAATSATRLEDLTGNDSYVRDLEEQRAQYFEELKFRAQELSRIRNSGALALSEKISDELNLLAMPHARVICDISMRDPNDRQSYQASGLDEVSLKFQSHEGSALLPISKAASGGELSRVMLAIEVVLAETSPVPTYIFDEVDAGVGGKAAIEVGKRLAKLAKNSQVIVVTHLAQVAVWANSHLLIAKSEDGLISNSNVTLLDGEPRKIEIARMLAGVESSDSAQKHAEELLEMANSDTWR